MLRSVTIRTIFAGEVLTDCLRTDITGLFQYCNTFAGGWLYGALGIDRPAA
jgi:hypothetical protein